MDDNKALKRSTLAVAAMASFVAPFTGSSVNLALPSIARQFSLDAVVLGWVATTYLLCTAVFLLPMGRAADIFGRRKVFLWGMILFTLGSLMSGLAPDVIFLIAARLVQGLGSAMTFGTAMAMVTSVFPPGERGRAMGLVVASVYSGLSLGPFLGGLLTQTLGWRSIFIVSVPLGFIVIALTMRYLKAEWAEAAGERLDLAGSLIYGAALVMLIYGLSTVITTGGQILAVAGLLGLGGFLFFESRVKSPIFDVSVFKNNPVFTMSNLAALINYAATFGVTFLMSNYLQEVRGLSPRAAGYVLVAQPLVMVVVSPLAGRVSDRLEPRLVASAGMGLTALALLSLGLIGPGTSLGLIVLSLVVLGAGFGLFSSPNTNAVMSSVAPRFLGVASATLSSMRVIGQMMSMGLVMMLLTLIMGRIRIGEGALDSFLTTARVSFIVFGALCVVGVFFSLARGRMHAAHAPGAGGKGPKAS